MPEFDSTIEYRDVPGFPGYKVGNDGSVWSGWTMGPSNRVSGRWHLLKQTLTKRGYLVVDFKGKVVQVHKAVLLSFVGPAPAIQFPHGRHLDGNPLNNTPLNLMWGTAKENCQDSIRHGTFPRGEKCGGAVLTEDDVREIRRLCGVMAQWRVAKRFKITQAAVSLIITGANWRHVV